MYTREEAKRLHLEFWNGFGRHGAKLKYLQMYGGRWMLYKTGLKGVELKFDIEREEMRIALEINSKKEDVRLDVYGQFEQYKKVFEEEFGGPLIWDFTYTTASGNDVCRIYVEKTEGFDFHRRGDWQRMYKFMADNMMNLEKALKEVKDVIKIPE